MSVLNKAATSVETFPDLNLLVKVRFYFIKFSSNRLFVNAGHQTIVVDYQYQHYNIGFSGLLWAFLANLNDWAHQKIQKITILISINPKTTFYIIFTA
jgi:hypothetical protein